MTTIYQYTELGKHAPGVWVDCSKKRHDDIINGAYTAKGPCYARTVYRCENPAASVKPVVTDAMHAHFEGIYNGLDLAERTEIIEGILKLAAPVAAQPSVPEPLKYGREWKDHYVTGWNNCRAAMLEAEQAKQDDPTPILYQHTDGRYGLCLHGQPAAFTDGDPAWYRVPIDIVEPAGEN